MINIKAGVLSTNLTIIQNHIKCICCCCFWCSSCYLRNEMEHGTAHYVQKLETEMNSWYWVVLAVEHIRIHFYVVWSKLLFMYFEIEIDVRRMKWTWVQMPIKSIWWIWNSHNHLQKWSAYNKIHKQIEFSEKWLIFGVALSVLCIERQKACKRSIFSILLYPVFRF